jgi:hypothetical protein
MIVFVFSHEEHFLATWHNLKLRTPLVPALERVAAECPGEVGRRAAYLLEIE